LSDPNMEGSQPIVIEACYAVYSAESFVAKFGWYQMELERNKAQCKNLHTV
jgi:hypothetical protein